MNGGGSPGEAGWPGEAHRGQDEAEAQVPGEGPAQQGTHPQQGGGRSNKNENTKDPGIPSGEEMMLGTMQRRPRAQGPFPTLEK